MSTVTLRSPDQRLNALAKANGVRTNRAVVKRQIKARPELILELLDSTPEWLQTAKAYEMVLAVPLVGATKANRLFASHGVSFTKSMGGLTGRQRAALIGELGLFLEGRRLPTARRPIVRAAPVPRSAPRARHQCAGCDEILARPSEDGLCGFCIRGLAA